MLKDLAELLQYRELLLNLVVRDLKVRYKNSVLGFFWSLVNPLLQVATITVVFKYILHATERDYSAYLLCAFLPWMFFQMSVLDSSMSVLYHGNLVKKTYFPREVLPVSIVLSNLVHFLLALGVFFVYRIAIGGEVLVTWLLLPVLILIQLMLNMGVAFFVSCLNVFYEDIKYVATVALNVLYFALPIMYFVEHVQNSQRIPDWLVTLLYYANPLPLILTAYRKILLPPYNTQTVHDVPFNYWWLALAGATSLVIFMAGYAFFNSKKWQFAERL
jgi:ABC-type polysaccharide/polyol phosphate export permease